jgi:pilus assembly protein CpaE
VRHTIPDDQPLVSMAVNRGVPLIMSHERSAVGKAMKELATLMINDAKGERDPAVAVAATLQALTNPFQRLLHRVRPVESRSA